MLTPPLSENANFSMKYFIMSKVSTDENSLTHFNQCTCPSLTFGPFVVLGVSGEYFHFYWILHRNSCKQSVDPDQILHFAVCELGLHSLHNYVPK